MTILYDLAIYVFALLLRVVALFNDKAKLLLVGQRQSRKLIGELIREQNHQREVIRNIHGVESRGVARGDSGGREVDDSKLGGGENYLGDHPSGGARATTYWVHCASLGEFEQGRPLIEAIKRQRADAKVLLTFFSPSGYEPRKNYPLADWVIYLPLDSPRNARRFMEAFRPDVAIFVKYEFWANYLKTIKRSGARCYIVSAIFRESMSFFKPWGGFFRGMLRNFDHFFVQNNQSEALLKGIGIDESVITVCGDTRFDRVSSIVEAAPELPLVQQFVDNSPCSGVMVCGSVWPEDTALLVELIKRNADWKFIIAPHNIYQNQIQDLVNALPSVVRYTALSVDASVPVARVLVVDCIGILSGVYRFGRVAYIGGGFGVGIHNILEAAAWGQPVIFGPNYIKFQEAVEMIKLSGAFSIKEYEELEKIFRALAGDSALLERSSLVAEQYVQSRCGATDRIIETILV